MELEARRGMPADRDIVYSHVTDLALLEYWAPQWLDFEGDYDEVMSTRVRGEPRQGLLRRSDDQYRLEWSRRGDDRYTGWLQVEGDAVGTAGVVIHLSLRDDALDEAGGHDAVQIELERTLDRLAREVGSRVNDAS